MIFATNRFKQVVIVGQDGTETPYVAPLSERIETTRQGRDDLYINRKFIEIMEHEDNAEIVRQANMILSMNDPEQPVEEAPEPARPARRKGDEVAA